MSYLTVVEVAELAKVAEKTVRRAISAGRLPSHRIGGSTLIRIRETDARAWIEGPSAASGTPGDHQPRHRQTGRARGERGTFADLMELDRRAAAR